MPYSPRSAVWLFRIQGVATWALLAASSTSSASTPPAAMSMAEVADKASIESKPLQVIERLADGRVRMTAPMQDLEALIGFEDTTLRSNGEAGEAGLRWQVQGVGRSDAMTPTPGAEGVVVEGDVVRVLRRGLIEEFRADADGIRQDFVVTSKPAGTGGMLLDLAVRGARLAPVAQHDGQAVAVHMTDGRVLHYHRLHVTDARDRVLAARMQLADSGGLRIAVEDEDAVYPVRIDPTFSDADWTALDLPAFNGVIRAALATGTQVFVGGAFTAANGGVAADRIAVWNGSSWSALGSGMDRDVRALAWDATEGKLYAGGEFSTAGGVAANYIAVWDGGSWAALGGGTDNWVYALAWDATAGHLYAGGYFTTAGATPANYVAMWDGGDWNALGDGTSANVFALAWDAANGRLFAGGQFVLAGGEVAVKIAAWNGSTWAALGSGMSDNVHALAWDAANARLYAGGDFNLAGGVAASHIAMWNGSSWSALGTGTNGSVYALTWDATASRLYAGGVFTSAGGMTALFLGMWNGSSWAGVGSGLDDPVYALSWNVASNLVYAGGSFTTAGGATANRIAAWNGSSWTALGSAGTNSDVFALAWDAANARLFAGGRFTTAGGVAARRIAVWNGSSWATLGSGMNSDVYALAWDAANDRLYAGGFFTAAGGSGASYVAVWNGLSWSALGSGMDNTVSAVVWDAANSRLFAAGAFTTAGGIAANRIAIWDGVSWTALGGGVNNFVADLAWDPVNNQLYACGEFTTAGGGAASRIAVWNGSSWAALDSGMNGPVTSLALDPIEGLLFAGGGFTTAGGGAANRIAEWDGSSWAPLGSGVNGLVHAIVWDATGSRLFAGGEFTTAGGTAANYIAAWNGSSWAALGSGTNRSVRALAWDADNRRLFAGGSFTSAGGQPASVVQAQFSLDAPRQVAPLTPAADDESLAPVTDASGRYTVFQSSAGNLTGLADGNGTFDIFRVDSESGDTVRVSLDDAGGEIAGGSIEPSVSADGQFVAFVAPDTAVNKVFGESAKARTTRLKGGSQGLFLRNMLTGRTSRLGTALPTGEGTLPRIAPDGMSVVFTGVTDSNEGTIGQQNVFRVPLTDIGGVRVPGEARQCVTCKARSAMGLEAGDSDGPSRNAALSTDGTIVVYETEAKNQIAAVPSPCQGVPTSEVNLRNMLTGQIRRISPPPGLAPVNCGVLGSGKPTMDWSGQSIAFESDQAIKPGTLPGTRNVFADFVGTGLIRISEQANGADADGDANEAAMSGDGRTVAYVSTSTNIDNRFADTNGKRDAHVKRRNRPAERLSLSTTGVQANADTRRPALNYNATKMVFDSPASNLVAGDINAVSDVFQRVVPTNVDVVFAAGFE